MNIIETNWNWTSGLSNRICTEYIVLHHAAAVMCTAAQVDQWHKSNGWSGIGYHYFIRKDGSIYRGRPEWALGAHVQGMNNCSLGICAEGNYDIEQTMPNTQYNAILALIADIHTRYPSAKVVGHKEIGSSDCPGRYYPLENLKNGSKKESEELSVAQYEELKRELSTLQTENAALKADLALIKNPMIYNYIDSNMPKWARDSVKWCVENGIIEGTGDGLGLDEKDLKWCVIIRRLASMTAKLINVKV